MNLTYLHPEAENTASGSHITAPAHAWLAVVVAAAGNHHLQLTGASGSGVPALAKAMRHVLPDLTIPAARRVRRLAAAATGAQLSRLDRRPPWRAPHHTSSLPSLLGNRTRPGAVSLAHHGVLYLNSASEFPRRQLDAVAHAIRARQIVLTFGATRRTYPASVQLVTGCDPCPCGATPQCTCSAARRNRYWQHLTPMTTLADLRVDLGQQPECDVYGLTGGDLAPLRARVAKARSSAGRRFGDTTRGIRLPGPDGPTELLYMVPNVPEISDAELRELVARGTLTSAQNRAVRRVAWTLADLARRARPTPADVTTALMLHGVNS